MLLCNRFFLLANVDCWDGTFSRYLEKNSTSLTVWSLLRSDKSRDTGSWFNFNHRPQIEPSLLSCSLWKLHNVQLSSDHLEQSDALIALKQRFREIVDRDRSFRWKCDFSPTETISMIERAVSSKVENEWGRRDTEILRDTRHVLISLSNW